MSVIKSERSESSFEVFHNLAELRKKITNFLLRDFGYSIKKQDDYIKRQINFKTIDELNEKQREHYYRLLYRSESFEEWFIIDERRAIISIIRKIISEVYIANSIYPVCLTELRNRRLHQDLAIGYCYNLVQELQYAIETLPVDINSYARYVEKINTEITLIKGWRKADNKKFKNLRSKGHLYSASNFANVNNNGNANNNNASNENGIRPDFDPINKRKVFDGLERRGGPSSNGKW